MITLGIETSAREGTVALLQDGVVLGTRRFGHDGRRHAQTLMLDLQQLLSDAGLTTRDPELIAVSIGPGSFTGLRVGVVAAKTLAWLTGARLAAVDTFLAIAENVPQEHATVHVISDAQRGDLFHGLYGTSADGHRVPLADIAIVSAEAWLDSVGKNDVVTGPGIARHEPLLQERCRVVPAELRNPKAEVIAALGARMAAKGRLADPATLEPFYLRRSAAEEKAAARRSAAD